MGVLGVVVVVDVGMCNIEVVNSMFNIGMCGYIMRYVSRIISLMHAGWNDVPLFSSWFSTSSTRGD